MRIFLVSLVTVLGVGCSAAAPADAGVPAIRIVGLQPLTVVGAHYRPGARVRVTVFARVRVSKVVTADRRGSLRAVFAAIRVGRCTAATLVVALSADGTRRVIKRLPAPDCPPLE